MLLLSPPPWDDYELIDCGGFEKLERFGSYVTIRPEPQAVWDKKIADAEWGRRAHVRFVQKASNAGEWQKLKQMPDKWVMTYPVPSHRAVATLKFRLSLTSFKHVGIFPEQAPNWDYIFNTLQAMKLERPRVLNLFAYTGGASLVARAAGADVTHLDSIRQVVSWARENMELSGLKDIRWVVEDALKFVRREVKRGHTYHGIILDPPAYGHGPDGEKWKLEEHIGEMIQHALALLDESKCFLLFNAYSLGFSSIILENLLKEKAGTSLETGELFLPATSGNKLPLGVFGRFVTGL